MEFEHEQYSPSFKNKLKTSIFCCYYYSDDSEEEDAKALEPSGDSPPSSPPSPPSATLSTWIKSELPELKERCVSLFTVKIRRNRRRGNSAEFGYDAMSYALNFEDDDSRIDEYPLRDFSARLPASPKKNAVVSREIAVWS